MRTRSIRFSLLSGSILAVFLSGCMLTKPADEPPEEATRANPSMAPPEVIAAPANMPVPADGPIRVEIFKGRREMLVKKGDRLIDSYEVRLGRSPRGDKRVQGDMRTPEGSYRICMIKPSKYRSFLWISYPNEEDAQRALSTGRLSELEYDRIVAALEEGRCPPYNTPLGGVVGIHGDYEEPARRYNWTEGCIALASNDDLYRLKEFVKPGTKVVIHP